MRLFATVSLLGCVLLTIGYLFYSQELKYWMLTPIPKGFKSIDIGSEVDVDLIRSSDRKFIHFYNPNCPCSKFNTRSYKSLLRQYGNDFACYVVIQKSIKGLTGDEIEFLKKLNVEIVVDTDRHLANAYGVYSTPQIVLVDAMNHIYYRGNYNQARYCSSLATNYAKIAIDSMLRGTEYLFPKNAFSAYGCSLDRKTY